ncbi:hypothetical protein D3C79_1099500 [compost metagenome]
MIVSEYFDAAIFLLDLAEKFQRFGFDTTVIQYKDLVVGVGAFLNNATHRSFSQ